MFLRRYERKKNGKGHVYWALVESIRTARGSRQKVVAYLGDVKKRQQTGWAALGRRLDKKDRPHPSLFDPAAYPEPAEDLALVQIKGVGLERQRDFGDVWLALGLWRLLKLDELLAARMEAGDEHVPWPVVAALLTIARFCEPGSELHIADTWFRRTALEDLLGVTVEQVHHRRLYEGLDVLLAHKEVLEQHLKQRLGDLFDLKYDLLLYDVTSPPRRILRGHVRGQSAGAARLFARQPARLPAGVHRPGGHDRWDSAVRRGGYEVFAGNTNDSKTVETMVQAMETKYGRASRIWVMDRGMVSEKNLQFLRERKGFYIVGTPKAMLRQFEQHLTSKDWHAVQAGVEVKLVPGPDGNETFILARSADRREKEQAMHQRFIQRMETQLQKLQASAESGRLREVAVAHQRLGRLKERYWRAVRRGGFVVQIAPLPDPTGKARLSITWMRDERWSEWSALSEGCYVLLANLTETDPGTLWKRYIQLTEAEWAFRISKDELEIRPIWHHTEPRVKAHILVCFLAYVLWKALAQWMKAAGLGDAPRTLLRELAKIKSGDVVLPTMTRDGQPGKTVRVRCVTTPDKAQKVLLHRLGLHLPQHLRYLEEVAQM